MYMCRVVHFLSRMRDSTTKNVYLGDVEKIADF